MKSAFNQKVDNVVGIQYFLLERTADLINTGSNANESQETRHVDRRHSIFRPKFNEPMLHGEDVTPSHRVQCEAKRSTPILGLAREGEWRRRCDGWKCTE
jgi:hypothetical protein